ncbi:MAG: SdpI family protein [Gordonia sp. (in: high G+C Gram-positive bacteria)]|uniref:SdpI family protein n=1 Tax=Gordonia sp. (in: high G+C Gram-positive bacteria) TaxID=84139 RepID=UPI0039E54951
MHTVSLAAAVIAFAIAALWAVTGVAGLLGRLPGNRWIGVRTPETGRTPETWTLAQRVAAPGYLGGAVAAFLGGALALSGRWGFLFALGGLVLGALAVSVCSGVAVRAAAAAAPAEESGCTSGCCSGDDAATSDSCADDPSARVDGAECGESSCGSCALNGMCTPESQSTAH